MLCYSILFLQWKMPRSIRHHRLKEIYIIEKTVPENEGNNKILWFFHLSNVPFLNLYKVIENLESCILFSLSLDKRVPLLNPEVYQTNKQIRRRSILHTFTTFYNDKEKIIRDNRSQWEMNGREFNEWENLLWKLFSLTHSSSYLSHLTLQYIIFALTARSW